MIFWKLFIDRTGSRGRFHTLDNSMYNRGKKFKGNGFWRLEKGLEKVIFGISATENSGLIT